MTLHDTRTVSWKWQAGLLSQGYIQCVLATGETQATAECRGDTVEGLESQVGVWLLLPSRLPVGFEVGEFTELPVFKRKCALA